MAYIINDDCDIFCGEGSIKWDAFSINETEGTKKSKKSILRAYYIYMESFIIYIESNCKKLNSL